MFRPEKSEEGSVSNECLEQDYDGSERTRADSFSLEFAASQWQNLVSNAEGLLMSLCSQGVPNETREQIQQWLFMKQECEGCFTNDGSLVKEKEAFYLDRIDEVTESESKSSIAKSESETEYSDSGAEIDDAVDLSQVEKRRQDFSDRLDVFMEKFRGKTDTIIAEFIGPIEPIAIPTENPRMPVSTYNLLKNQRRKSFIPLNLIENDRLPSSESSKKEFDLQSSLTQSKKYIKKFLRQLRKDSDQVSNSEKDEDAKKSKESQDKSKKLDKSLEKSANEEKKVPSKVYSDRHEDERRICAVENRQKALLKIDSKHVYSQEEKALRDEITNLRFTRDFLVEQRKSLDTKLNRDRAYTNSEQRRFLELDEAIEAVDSTIEYKNGAICGRKSFEEKSREEGEQMLLDRLMKLSEPEMRSLLFKYFQKTVDLRECGRTLEQEVAELDHRIEAQAWKIQALSGALQHANVKNESRLVTVHREHEEKLHLMFKHYTGTGTSSSADTHGAGTEEPRALLPSIPQPNAAAIPQQNLRKLQGTSSPHTTKVTRQRNKLIIQQHHKK